MPVSQPITDFRGGLDTRRMSLALPAGTLITCNNAHINQGAEIEKRKAFVQFFSDPIPAVATFPTFGACATPAGIALFGSGNIVTGAAPTATQLQAFVAPLYYVMLTHPAVLAGVGYAITLHSLTAIVAVQLFGQFPFCSAQFADGGIYCYYNGSLVPDFIAGVVLAYMANGTTSQNQAAVATALANLINNTDNYTAQASGSFVDVLSLPGSSFEATSEVLAGNITVTSNVNINYATGTVTNDTGNNPADGQTVTIGGQVYRFKIFMAQAFDIQIAITSALTLKNLFLAIGATGAAGVNYFAGTSANTEVKASLFMQTPNPTFTLTSTTLLLNGVTENTIPGVSLTEENSSSFATVYGTPSQGQFQITAVGGSVSAFGTITSDGTNPTAGATVTIGPTTYTFAATASPTGDANHIVIGPTAVRSLQRLVFAVTCTGTPGSDYGGATVPNTQVSAVLASATVAIFTALVPGAPGNSVVLTGGAHLTASGSGTLTAGISSGVSQIYAGPLSASASITTNGSNPANNSTLTVGSTTYTLVATLAGAPANSVLIGITAQDTVQNIIDAINGTGIYGINNSAGSENQQVLAITTTQNAAMVLIARTVGDGGNAIAILTSGVTNLTVPATFTGGVGTVNVPTSGAPLLAAPFYAGPTQSASQFAASLSGAINANSAASGFSAFVKNQTVYINSNIYGSYDNNAEVSAVVIGEVAIGVGGFAFSLVETGGGSVGQITCDANNLMTGTVSLGSNTISAFVAAIAANINANTNASNEPGAPAINAFFTAVPVGNILYISKITTTSNDFPLTTTASPDGVYVVASQVGPAGLTASIPGRLNIPPAGQSSVTCNATGGYPPYTYNWQILSTSDPTLGLQILTNGQSSANFSVNVTSPNPHATVNCTVTDSQQNTVVSNNMSVGKA